MPGSVASGLGAGVGRPVWWVFGVVSGFLMAHCRARPAWLVGARAGAASSARAWVAFAAPDGCAAVLVVGLVSALLFCLDGVGGFLQFGVCECSGDAA